MFEGRPPSISCVVPERATAMYHQKIIIYNCDHSEILPSKKMAYSCDLASRNVFPNRHCHRVGKRWYTIVRVVGRCPDCRLNVVDGTGHDPPPESASSGKPNDDGSRHLIPIPEEDEDRADTMSGALPTDESENANTAPELPVTSASV